MPDHKPLAIPGTTPAGDGEATRPRGEQWRTAPGWSAYEVSSRGRVRSVDRVLADGRTAGGKLLKPTRDKDGYRYVTLSDGQRRWRVHVARLVLMAFAGWPPEGAEACHRNGRRWDNRAANLYWGTKPQNRADRERHRAERGARERARGSGVTGEIEGVSGFETGETGVCRGTPVSVAAETGRSA